MASYKKLPSGKWQAQIARKGMRKSAGFATKREAQDWAVRQEYLADTSPSPKPKTTFADALRRYAREESRKKRGQRWEVIRIDRFLKDKISNKPISELKASDFALWRDARLQRCHLAPSTVR